MTSKTTEQSARRSTGRRPIAPRKASIARGTLPFLIALAILAAALARGLPEPHQGVVPDWNPADTVAH